MTSGLGLDDLEEALIQHAVRIRRNLSGAARLLRITRPQLNYRLEEEGSRRLTGFWPAHSLAGIAGAFVDPASRLRQSTASASVMRNIDRPAPAA